MPRKNRAYKRGEPHRDSRLFVIICEGEKREREYFYEVHRRSQKVRIKVIENEDDAEWKSAPKWLLDKAVGYVEEFGLNESDFLWFVIDVDNWGFDQIHALADQCNKNHNWNISISNPCFEVWLFMHIDDIGNSKSTTCKEFKSELVEITKGEGYNVEKFVSLIMTASQRAEMGDSNKNHYMPEVNESKLYTLANQLHEFTGQDLLM